jgi:hypothetical protein
MDVNLRNKKNKLFYLKVKFKMTIFWDDSESFRSNLNHRDDCQWCVEVNINNISDIIIYKHNSYYLRIITDK